MLDAQQRPSSGPLREQGAAPPQIHDERHDELFAQRVDRGIRHLGEALAHIRVETLRHAGERCDRRVVAHAPDRVLPFAGHRRHDEFEIFVAVAEGVLARGQLVRRQRRADRGDVGRELAHDPAAPAPIGTALGHLDLGVGTAEDDVAQRIDHEQLARAEPSRLDDVGGIEVDDADFGRSHHDVVAGHLVAAGTQPVAVECRAGDHTVAKGDCGRSVPRLHQPRVILVEAAQCGIHFGDSLPRLRQQHHERVHRVASRTNQQLERIVEARRVAAVRPDHGLQLLDVLLPHRRGKGRLTRQHRVAVAPQRVDLAIVREQPERLRQRPAGQRVGRVALMKDRDAGFEQR